MSQKRAPAKDGLIPPDLDLHALVEQTPNFQWVDRISCRAIDEAGLDAFEKTVEQQVIKHGKPLIVDGWHHKLERWTFRPGWLHDNVGNKEENARWLNRQTDMKLTISHYLKHMNVLCDQWDHYNYKDPKRQRLYLKDIDCPDLWHEKLRETIPASVFYLNDSTGEIGGPGSVEEAVPGGSGVRVGKGVARCGDLMSCLPSPMRAENLMCYIGHEGTYTPAHREMCASLGQNLMVETSQTLDENGKRVKPGSSIWFMTETSDRQVLSEYWQSALGHDIEVEKHFAHINAWRKAPFTVYVAEQQVGDLILIPPLAPHQVWNRGTRTIKVAWNRTTVDTLEYALDEALPRARLVCRDEQYKNKAIVLFALNKYAGILSKLEHRRGIAAAKGDERALKALTGHKTRQLRRDFKRLFVLLNRIVLSESFSPNLPPEKKVEYVPYQSNITCAYCRCNIFNRFLTCRNCVGRFEDGEDDTYDVCMECYAMGRSCKCVGRLEWVEQFPYRDLLEKHEMWRRIYVQISGGPKDDSPQPLMDELKFSRKRTLAEICQIELKKRPFRDPQKQEQEKLPDASSEPSDSGDDVDANSASKKKNVKISKRNSAKNSEQQLACHFCCYRHPIWKEAICTDCGAAFCYGSLWRGFNMLPQEIMEDKTWTCPKCKNFCTCTNCRKRSDNVPFEPTGTVLGHDTRAFADPRSLESLVDFSVSNRHWIRKSGDVDDPASSRRLQKRRSEAQELRANAELEDKDGDNISDIENGSVASDDSRTGTSDDDIPIDPALTGAQPSATDDSSLETAQNQALEALEMMGNLSRLEQDPKAFVKAAGLADLALNEDNPQLVSTSITPGVSKKSSATGQAKSVNGVFKRRPQNRHHKATTSAPAAGDAEGLGGSTGFPETAANERFQALVERERIGEAKKNKQLVAARAAVKGLKKIVTLKLSSSKLAGMASNSVPDQASNAPMLPTKGQQSFAQLVHSNLVPGNAIGTAATRTRSARSTTSGKKRIREEDLDIDFVTARGRRTQKAMRELRETAVQDLAEDEGSDSELRDTAMKDRPQAEMQKSSSSRRSLPSYMARRNEMDETAASNNIGEGERDNTVTKTDKPLQSRPSKEIIRDENRLAKLRAAQGLDEEDSSSNSAESVIEHGPGLMGSGGLRPDKTPSQRNQSLSSSAPSHSHSGKDRQSIFDRRNQGVGKIKVGSRRTKS